MISYAQVPTGDGLDALDIEEHGSSALVKNDANGNGNGHSNGHGNSYGPGLGQAVRNDDPVPITRPPTKGRDFLYFVGFILHFILVSLFWLLEKKHNEDCLIPPSKAGLWSSMVMFVTLLGSFFGALTLFLLSNYDTRDFFLSAAIPTSILIQGCLANVLFILRNTFSFVGVFFLLAAAFDTFRFKRARDNLQFSSALIGMVNEICSKYGTQLSIICGAAVAIQTCILLWWCTFLVGLLSHVSLDYVAFFLIGMAISLYWTINFFHGFVAYIIGGCMLWYFVRESTSSVPGGSGDIHQMSRVLMHAQTAATTSVGSICKGAIFTPFCQAILSVNIVARGPINSAPYPGHQQGCSFSNCIGSCVAPIVPFSRRHTRLAYAVSATYGRTFTSAAEWVNAAHPYSVDLVSDDNAQHTLSAAAICISGIVTFIFGLFVGRAEGTEIPLFFVLVFCLIYSGVSICVYMYKAAVDAIIVAFAIAPELLARENQIVYLRYLRTTETMS